jgi:hypothetical protein
MSEQNMNEPIKNEKKKKYVRCKVCGYIMEEGKVHDVCPACGVLAKMFEPYEEKLSEKRKRILDLHIHPIIVHMPQGLGFFLLAAFITLLFLSAPVKNSLSLTLKIISSSLFVSIIGAFLAGLLDGKIRFKKITTPILKQKIVLGIIFFLFSAAIIVNIFFFSLDSIYNNIALIAEGIGAFVCSWILGTLGESMNGTRFPG